MALYDQYTVVKSNISVRFMNQGNSRPYVGIMVRDTNSISSTVVDMMEYGDSKVSAKPLQRLSEEQPAWFPMSSCDVAKCPGSKGVLDNPELK